MWQLTWEEVSFHLLISIFLCTTAKTLEHVVLHLYTGWKTKSFQFIVLISRQTLFTTIAGHFWSQLVPTIDNRLLNRHQTWYTSWYSLEITPVNLKDQKSNYPRLKKILSFYKYLGNPSQDRHKNNYLYMYMYYQWWHIVGDAYFSLSLQTFHFLNVCL